ncbi:hypothetical protein EDD15DRAFT_2370695 [Pisolithus albus]|nr:hypothetical protein EDD15DRAFT_2370695 [Pisolithus albus]
MWRENQTNPQPYFGFYSEGIPILAHPPVVQGSFQHAISSQVASLPTALVHLHMDNLEVGHAQVNIMNSYLQPYFPQGSYQFSQLPFNLATQESLHDYEKAAMDLAHSLSSFSRVVLFLTTHSDEERGDLFSGEVDGKPIASKVSECLQVLFHPLTKIVKGADVIFNVCGSVVTVQDSFDDLKEAAHKSMIFFDAQHLQLATTTPYLLSLLESIVIQGFDIAKAVKFALNDCALLDLGGAICQSSALNVEPCRSGNVVLQDVATPFSRVSRPPSQDVATPPSEVGRNHSQDVATPPSKVGQPPTHTSAYLPPRRALSDQPRPVTDHSRR